MLLRASVQNKEYHWGTKFMKIEARRGRLERKYFRISSLRHDVIQEKIEKKDNRQNALMYVSYNLHFKYVSNVIRK